MKPLYTRAATRSPDPGSPRPPRGGAAAAPHAAPGPAEADRAPRVPHRPDPARYAPRRPPRPSPPRYPQYRAPRRPRNGPHLRVDGGTHAGEGVRRGRVVGEAVPGRGSAAAAGGGRLVLPSEALVHHVGCLRGRAVLAERPAGEGEEGPAASLCPVRAARLSLRCRSCLCRWSIARRRPLYTLPPRESPTSRGTHHARPRRGPLCPRPSRPAPPGPAARPAEPPGAGNNGAAGREERGGAGGAVPGFPPPSRSGTAGLGNPLTQISLYGIHPVRGGVTDGKRSRLRPSAARDGTRWDGTAPAPPPRVAPPGRRHPPPRAARRGFRTNGAGRGHAWGAAGRGALRPRALRRAGAACAGPSRLAAGTRPPGGVTRTEGREAVRGGPGAA